MGFVVAAEEKPWCQEVAIIDKTIQDLQEKRLNALGRAERFEDDAIRWQFRGGQFNETRNAYAQAAAAREEAEKCEKEIRMLEDKKCLILQKQGSCP